MDETTLEMFDEIIGKMHYPFKVITHEIKGGTDFSGKIMPLNNPVNIARNLGMIHLHH